MENRTILRLRFPYEDNVSDIAEKIKRFETFFYNVFFLLLRRSQILSFEIVVVNGIISFYILTPSQIADSVISLFFADFPDAEITKSKEYIIPETLPKNKLAFQLQVVGGQTFTLRTVSKVKTDSLNSFLNLLSDVPTKDVLLYQLVVNPIDDVALDVDEGGLYGVTEKEETLETNPRFKVSPRIIYCSPENEHLKNISPSLRNSFSPFSTEQNYLRVNLLKDPELALNAFLTHNMGQTSTLNNEELAGLFHFPDPKAKIRGIDWLFARKAEPPMNLPTAENTPREEISLFGVTNFRGKQIEFGIHREDRRRHLYVVGKSGTGKSKLLEQLIASDIKAAKGLCVIDPHGDLIQDILLHVPENRIDDVIYFNPADLEFPIAFNPLVNVAREFKQQVTQGFIEIFKKFFGADWSPKIEHVFRFTVLALLDYKKASILGLQKMLTDRAYRQKVVAEIQDQIVKKFWTTEFAGWSEKFDNEAIVPMVNKLGQFLSNEMVRNIVGQSSNKVHFEDIMNNERILLIELSKGKLGEENSSLLGSLIITKIQQEGMARAGISRRERKDFYLYVDEFQNFATNSFENILSESRKYGLSLTVSHQYLGQLATSVRETIFGNVSSLITFRLGADDAKYMAQELTPHFSANDIINLGVREIYLKISIRGLFTHPFSARTIDVEESQGDENLLRKIIDTSREKYTTPLKEVEEEFDVLYAADNSKPKISSSETFEQPLI